MDLYNIYEHYLMHHGVKGQKWGVKNGPPYPIGSSPRKVFISGTSKFNRNELPDSIKGKIDEYVKKNYHILIGDAPGIDTSVQKYLKGKGHKNVTIYTTENTPRHNSDLDGKLGWGIKKVDVPQGENKDGYNTSQVYKDRAMCKDAHTGFAVVLEEGSKNTKKNVDRLYRQGKDAEVLMLNPDGTDEWLISQNEGERPHADYNMSKWGKDPNHNILYVTGFSGSGKSTYATKLGKENSAEVIHLDLYTEVLGSHNGPEMNHRPVIEHPDYKSKQKGFYEFLNEKDPDWRNKRAAARRNTKELGDFLSFLEKSSLEYSAKMQKKGKKLIFEGIQIFNGSHWEDKSFYKDKPIIFMKTSMYKSIVSADLRHLQKTQFMYDIEPSTNISSRREWYQIARANINDLENVLKTKVDSIDGFFYNLNNII